MWLILLMWTLNLAESWQNHGRISLPNTLYLGLCNRKRGGGFLEEKEVPTPIQGLVGTGERGEACKHMGSCDSL